MSVNVCLVNGVLKPFSCKEIFKGNPSCHNGEVVYRFYKKIANV
jgi:hypothetical protein